MHQFVSFVKSGLAMRLLMLLLLVCATLGVFISSRSDAQSFIIATATPGGTFYPVGVGIGLLVTDKLHQSDNITASAITSAGSGENIHMLQTKEADFAILQALFGAKAWKGEGAYKGKEIKDIRSVTVLWVNVEHFVILKKYSQTGNIQDLKEFSGKLSIGNRGSGTEGSGKEILSALDIETEDSAKGIKLEYLGYNASTQSIIDGRIEGANMPGGIPISAITQLYAQLGEQKLAVLQIDNQQLAKITEKYQIWTRYIIKAGTYPGQEHDIHTIAQPNFLVCRADLSEQAVYMITKTIYENLSYLQNIHQATNAMKLEKAIQGLPLPLHPGALRYYKEQGLEIPERLVPEQSKQK